MNFYLIRRTHAQGRSLVVLTMREAQLWVIEHEVLMYDAEMLLVFSNLLFFVTPLKHLKNWMLFVCPIQIQ